MEDAQLGEVLRELTARGFRSTGNRRGVRSFDGTLNCRGHDVRVELSISDWDFVTYPDIKVVDGWIDPTLLVPHVNRNGYLCYYQNGSVVLDRYQPAGAIVQCLEQARQVLERIKFDSTYRQSDIQDEFLVHWVAGQSSAVWEALLGTVDPKSKTSAYWVVDVNGTPRNLIADSAEEVSALAAAFSASPPKQSTCPCWLMESALLPSVPARMPATVKELFDWLKEWDKKVYNGVQRVLEKEPRYLEFKHASFAVKTLVGWLGFGFALDPRLSPGAKRKPLLYKQYLHKAGGKTPIRRLWITELGPQFVHGRNLAFESLAGKRVTVVGCGAIGSYVAQALVRLGAGTSGGKLKLLDMDKLEPENLGRHVLGYPALFQDKAQALRDELARQFPLSVVEPQVIDVRDATKLFDTDLVVDATGEEAVSELLNFRRLRSRSSKPILHVWILGNGEAVQALWAQGRELGCYRCLQVPDAARYRQPRYPVLKATPTRRVLGCRAFTPYAVSAPMYAASLATEMVVDWLRLGAASPIFRTRTTDNANVARVKNQDLTRLDRCPACGTSDAA